MSTLLIIVTVTLGLSGIGSFLEAFDSTNADHAMKNTVSAMWKLGLVIALIAT